MRKRNSNSEISVHAIAGSEVVLLGLNAKKAVANKLLGFTISKRKKGNDRWIALRGNRRFESSSYDKPVIQAFLWGDYVVDPNSTYSYRITPLYGDPAEPTEGKTLSVTVSTEDPEKRTHAVYFNRGVAGSQQYARRFGKHARWYKVERYGKIEPRPFIKPEDVPKRSAYRWLSRGLEEAMLAFINQAKGSDYALRAAVYELTYAPAIQAFVDALERGADVKIVRHAKREKLYRLKQDYNAVTTVDFEDGEQESEIYNNRKVVLEQPMDGIGRAADAAIGRIGLTKLEYLELFDQMTIERTVPQIAHNKFIVLLKKGRPVQVWTGSTNFTAGGIFGQSNVGHVIRSAKVAQQYHEYWKKIATDPRLTSRKSDPEDAGLRNWTVLQQPDLKGPPPPNSITPVFSPRLTKKMLEWYADRLAAAKSSVCFTAAFSVADEILEKVKKRKRVAKGEPYLRYLMLESIGGKMKAKYRTMAKCRQNRIAWGATRRPLSDRGEEHSSFLETLTGLNSHVEYLHTKYMLIDPLSDDPIVISGSANFSKASTVNNDENMLIIRGNKRLADIFLGEFMRLFNHFKSRNEPEGSDILVPDSSWTAPYFESGTQQFSERKLFA